MLVSAVVFGIAAASAVSYADGFGALPWKVGSSLESNDTYTYYLCSRGDQSTNWGRTVANSDGCQNITLTFYGPFTDDGGAYWFVQAYGVHPEGGLPKSAMLTVRLSNLDVDPVFFHHSLATTLENTIFYTAQYDRTNLNVGFKWHSRTLPEMTVYSHADGVYFSGYRDDIGRTNGMSFAPLVPLPLSAEMPDRGFSFRMVT